MNWNKKHTYISLAILACIAVAVALELCGCGILENALKNNAPPAGYAADPNQKPVEDAVRTGVKAAAPFLPDFVIEGIVSIVIAVLSGAGILKYRKLKIVAQTMSETLEKHKTPEIKESLLEIAASKCAQNALTKFYHKTPGYKGRKK